MSEASIAVKTGCRAICERKEWKTTLVYDRTVPKITNSAALELRFFFANGRYQLRKEYYTYTADDLIADAGGLLGLFLGHSILSSFDFVYNTFMQPTKNKGVTRYKIYVI